MERTSMCKFGYVWMVLQGLFSLVAPRKATKMATKGWRAGFENVEDLEPRDWYVTMTRALGVGMVAAGIAGLLFEKTGDADDAGPSLPESEDESEANGNAVEMDA